MRRDPLSCHHRRGTVLVENIRGTGANEDLSHKKPKSSRFNLQANHLRCQVQPRQGVRVFPKYP